MEQIYYKEINLDDEGNFTMDITKDTLLTKKLRAGQEYVVSGLSIKPLRNNDVTKWDDFAKIVALSEKINNAKPAKNGLFDLTSGFDERFSKRVFWRKTKAPKLTRNKNVQIL